MMSGFSTCFKDLSVLHSLVVYCFYCWYIVYSMTIPMCLTIPQRAYLLCWWTPGMFHFRSSGYSTAMNILVQVCLWIYAFISFETKIPTIGISISLMFKYAFHWLVMLNILSFHMLHPLLSFVKHPFKSSALFYRNIYLFIFEL